jgi:DNA-binding Xre family transcriptional regulator
MNVIVSVIKQRLAERGATISFVASGVPMKSDLLSKVLLGQRRLRADEFLQICRILELNLSDFYEFEETNDVA